MNKENRAPLLLLELFGRVRRERPKLFYFLLCFSVLQLGFTFLKLEVTPFFLYGMYSEKISRPDTLRQRRVLVNGRPLESLSIQGMERGLLYTTIDNYLLQKGNRHIDPVQTRVEERYPAFTHAPFYPALKNYESWFKENT